MAWWRGNEESDVGVNAFEVYFWKLSKVLYIRLAGAAMMLLPWKVVAGGREGMKAVGREDEWGIPWESKLRRV